MRLSFNIFTSFIILSALLLGIASISRYFIFDPVLGNQLIIKQGLEMYKMDYKPWNYILYIHIITATVALMIGPLQFLQNKKKSRHLAVHRLLGKVYIVSIMISGLAGIYLSWYAFGGLLSKIGFLALSISWLVTTYLAYSYIRKKKIKLHKEWMYRSYAITLVAVTFRIWSAVIGYSFDNFTLGYVGAIWLGLIGNILAAEIWIRRMS
jgi:uncharacterized membrane protein